MRPITIRSKSGEAFELSKPGSEPVYELHRLGTDGRQLVGRWELRAGRIEPRYLDPSGFLPPDLKARAEQLMGMGSLFASVARALRR